MSTPDKSGNMPGERNYAEAAEYVSSRNTAAGAGQNMSCTVTKVESYRNLWCVSPRQILLSADFFYR